MRDATDAKTGRVTGLGRNPTLWARRFGRSTAVAEVVHSSAYEAAQAGEGF
jgi:hypothetical protein